MAAWQQALQEILRVTISEQKALEVALFNDEIERFNAETGHGRSGWCAFDTAFQRAVMASAEAPAAYAVPELLMKLRDSHLASIEAAGRLIRRHDETRRELPEMADAVATVTLPTELVRVSQLIDKLVQFAGFNNAASSATKAPPCNPDEQNEQSELLRVADPDARYFMDGKRWCDSHYAKERFGIGAQRLTRAATQERGLGGIAVTRRKAQVSQGKRGQVWVYHAGDLQRLANHLDREE